MKALPYLYHISLIPISRTFSNGMVVPMIVAVNDVRQHINPTFCIERSEVTPQTRLQGPIEPLNDCRFVRSFHTEQFNLMICKQSTDMLILKLLSLIRLYTFGNTFLKNTFKRLRHFSATF